MFAVADTEFKLPSGTYKGFDKVAAHFRNIIKTTVPIVMPVYSHLMYLLSCGCSEVLALYAPSHIRGVVATRAALCDMWGAVSS